jgi:hypothetical protein
MAGFVGADIAQMQELERTLSAQADQLDQIMGTIKSKVHGTDWRGPDADRFRNEWDGTHTRNLNRVVANLRDTARIVRGNWQDQQRVSQG